MLHVVGGAGAGLQHQRSDGDRVGRQQQRVAIRVGARDIGAADGAGGAGAVFHHHRLLQPRAELVGHQAGEHVHVAAGGVGHHDGDRLVGVAALGHRGQGGEQGGSAEGRTHGGEYVAADSLHGRNTSCQGSRPMRGHLCAKESGKRCCAGFPIGLVASGAKAEDTLPGAACVRRS
ncbi:hypothetical protein D3C81_1374320 [compost metagenome]